MFQGSMVALVTPMLPDGQIDHDSLAICVDFHISAGTDAIVVAGTTGELASLSSNEHTQIIEQVVQQVNGRIPVIAGSGVTSTAKTIKLTRAAKAAGADACLLMAPAYVKPTQDGLYQHYTAIADAVAIPQILYNVPARTACDILPETVARLADHANIVGIKEASGQIERIKAILAECGKKIEVYAGDDALAKDIIQAGGSGVISVTANVVPERCHQLCQAALLGDVKQAEQMHQALLPLHRVLFCESNPIPVKWAMYRMGLISTGIRLPLTPLNDASISEVELIMRQLGVLN